MSCGQPPRQIRTAGFEGDSVVIRLLVVGAQGGTSNRMHPVPGWPISTDLREVGRFKFLVVDALSSRT